MASIDTNDPAVKARRQKKADAAKAANEAKAKRDAADPKKQAAKAAKEKAAADKKAKAEAEKAKGEVLRAKAAEKVKKELAPLVKEINVRLEKADKAEMDADDMRLAAAIHLAKAKEKCEEVKLDFKAWMAENMPDRSPETLRKLAAIGSSPEPRVALEDFRARQAGYQAKNREKTKQARLSPPASRETSKPEGKKGPKETPFKRADEALSAMEDKAAVELMKTHAKKHGLVVVSETAAKSLAATGGNEGLDGLFKLFDDLTPRQKQQFVTYAAGKTGYKLVADEVDTAPNPKTGIPGFLDASKRGKKAA